MKKYILSTIILIAVVGMALSSCDSNEKVELSLDGEWIVYERSIKCKENGQETPVATDLQLKLNEKFLKQIKTNVYIYKFGNQVSTKEGTFEYFEIERKRGALETEMPVSSLTGYYKKVDGGLLVAVEAGNYDNWEFKNYIIDLNHEHVMFEQNMGEKDLEIMADLLLGSGGSVNSSMTAVLKTKAEKKKK